MDHRNILDGIVSPDASIADHDICSTRRGLVVAPLLAALSLALSNEAAFAGKINSSETQITLPGAIEWGGWIAGSPPHSGEVATLYGGLDGSTSSNWTGAIPKRPMTAGSCAFFLTPS